MQFETTLLSDPTILGNYQYMQVTTGNFWHSASIRIKASAKQQYSYGDTLQISGTLTSSLYHNKPEWVLKATNIKAESEGLLPVFGEIRQHIITLSGETFPRQYSSLVLGILLGIKKDLSAKQVTVMRATGFSHFMVIDGMKITLFVSYIVAFLGAIFARRTALVLSMVFVGLYMVLSGLEVSALRAGIMAMAALSAQFWGRQYTGLYSLFLTGGLLLLWDPLLLENIGFQLSVLATAGIILIKPLIPLKGIFLDDINITVSAQIATMPILLAAFGSYGLLSIPAHAFVLWTVPFIMIINGTGALLGFLFLPLGSLIMQLSIPLVWYFQGVMFYFSNFNWNWQVPIFTEWSVVGYSLIVSAGIIALRGKSSSLHK